MKRFAFPLIILFLLMPCCDTSGPNMSINFPFYNLQDYNFTWEPEACCFIGTSNDGLITAGGYLYFLDHNTGVILAEVDIGYTLADVAASPDGGYALTISDAMFHYVSNETYQIHDPIVLNAGSPARFIFAKPSGGMAYIIHSNGTITLLNTISWNVSSYESTSVSNAVAAAISADGSAIFIADDEDGYIKKISTSSFETLAQCEVTGDVSDLNTGPGNSICAAVEDIDEVWIINGGTGQHESSISVGSTPYSVAATYDGNYIFAGCQGKGLVVYDTTGEIQAERADLGVASDIALGQNGNRALICIDYTLKAWMLRK